MKHDIRSLYTEFILKARKIKTKLIMARSDFELKYTIIISFISSSRVNKVIARHKLLKSLLSFFFALKVERSKVEKL